MAKMRESIAAIGLSTADTARILGDNAQGLYGIT
jgi:hypothetical protein